MSAYLRPGGRRGCLLSHESPESGFGFGVCIVYPLGRQPLLRKRSWLGQITGQHPTESAPKHLHSHSNTVACIQSHWTHSFKHSLLLVGVATRHTFTKSPMYSSQGVKVLAQALVPTSPGRQGFDSDFDLRFDWDIACICSLALGFPRRLQNWYTDFWKRVLAQCFSKAVV